MERYYLHIEWHYTYDKEGTWFDTEDGENTYLLEEGAVHSLPHLIRKTFTITSVRMEDGKVVAEVYADYRTVTITEGASTTAHASASYCAAGDSVEQNLYMTLTLLKRSD